MLELLQDSLSDDKANKLTINCGAAYFLSDKEGFLEQFDGININCGAFFASSNVYAKLIGKGAMVNSGNSSIREISSEIIQLEHEAEVTFDMDFTNKFIFAKGNVIVKGEGGKAFANAEGAHICGTLYYPEQFGSVFFANITGDKCAYPDNAFIVTSNKTVNQLINTVPDELTHIWVHGEISATDEKALKKAKDNGLNFTCDSLFIYEALNENYSALFKAENKEIVPDGHEITSDINLTSGEASLYGPRIYVRGNLTLSKKDEGSLDELESIIVTGTATLPTSCAKKFREIGKAEKYELIPDDVGEVLKVNGFQTVGHEFLQALIAKNETIVIKVNGMLLLNEGVTPDDMNAISSLHVNGAVIMPDAAQGALAPRVNKINGTIMSIESVTELTGLSLQEILAKLQNPSNRKGTLINTGEYVLV